MATQHRRTPWPESTGPDEMHAPVPGWGVNPRLAGPVMLDVGGFGEGGPYEFTGDLTPERRKAVDAGLALPYGQAEGLGKAYQIPTKSSSAWMPDMTITADVPIEQISWDVLNYLWPEITSRVVSLVPWLMQQQPVAQSVDQSTSRVLNTLQPLIMSQVQQSLPSVIAQATPLVEQQIPQIIDSVQQQVIDKAWPAIIPRIQEEVQKYIVAEERKAALYGGLAVATIVGAVWWFNRKASR